MNIRLEYSLTPEDHIEFQRAFPDTPKRLPAKTPPKYLSPSFWGWVVILGFAVSMFIVFRVRMPVPLAAPAPKPPNPEPGIMVALPYLLILALVLSYVFLRLRFPKSAIKKAFDRDPRLAERQQVTLCDEHATFRTETASSVFIWTHFTHFAETKTLFVLLVSQTAAQLIPKRAFGSPQEMEEFRGFALAHVGNTPIGFPVQVERTRGPKESV